MRSFSHATRILFVYAGLILVGARPAFADALIVPSGTTTLPADTVATYSSITVKDGATLDVGGGSEITITEALTVEAGGTILCRSKDITAQVNGAWSGSGVTLHAGSALIAPTGLISADGQGYRNGVGPGMPEGLLPTSGDARLVGASHGGVGTPGNSGATAAPAYGDSLEPKTPGQGAGYTSTEVVAGGGALRLIVDGTLKLDGAITANGVSTGSNRGGATGGSLWVTAGTLTGTGRFAADAAAGRAAGIGHSAGGRIAVYYGVGANFEGFLTSTVSASNAAGQPGTLAFIDTAVANGGALRVSRRLTLDKSPVASFGAIQVDGGGELMVGPGVALRVNGALSVTGNSVLQLANKDVLAQVNGTWAGTGATIEAGSVTVATGSRISVDGEGYRNAAGPGVPAGLDPISTDARRVGASHGGAGTKGSSTVAPVAAYGVSFQPTTPGQGAGHLANDVVAGGGALRLIVNGTLTLDGTISANGVGSGSSRGGATGGSLWVTTQSLAGTGRFVADAAAGTVTAIGHSGGGRIAVYYGGSAGFDGFLSSSVNPSNVDGEAGTLLFVDTSVQGGALRVNQRMVIDQGPIASFGSLLLENGADVEVAPGVALDIDQTLSMTGNSTLQLHCKNQLEQVDGGWLGTGAIIIAENVSVGPGSRISVDGEGYRNGNGPGFPIGLPTASAYRTGASYGGRGTGTGALPPYGDPLRPVALGTGGGTGDDQTAGGGALRLIVRNTLALDGQISANGVATAPGFQVSHGGATGGSLWVTTRTLNGSGRFAADSYPAVFINGNPKTGHSSGGRVAVYYESAAGYTGMNTSSASAPKGDADPGSLLFLQDNGGKFSARALERLDILEGRTLELDNLVLDTGARLDLYGGSNLRVADTLDVRAAAQINFWSRNRDAAFAGAWIGDGSRIDAGDMRVASTAVLTADGQGYRDGMGPGGPDIGDNSNTRGGSYGGKGSGAAKDPYGSIVAPLALGSAGGYNRNSAHPNTSTTAGGAIFLNVARALDFDGLATATGEVRDTTHAGATGGSILIRADRLSGSGRLVADAIGGSGNNQSAGGRIAIWSSANSLPAANISARAGGPTAQNGTIHQATTASIAWIRTPLETFSGPVRLEWLTTGSAGAIGVDVDMQPAAGPAATLASGLAPTASFLWDTTTLPDGTYTLTVRKRDTRTGSILGTDTRTVTLLNNATVLRGTLTQNVTLPAGRVSFIVGPIVIPAGVTVTAEPGAIVKVSLGASVVVEPGAALIASGTALSPILFTSLLDDTAGGDSNFDGSATAPGVVDWNGLRSNGGTITFNEFAEVRHAVEMIDNDITTTVRWRAGSVRVITRQIDIIRGGSLTIEPGAMVKFATRAGLRVIGGSLSSEGTLLRPVIFTSERDDSVGGDSNGDGGLTSPIAGTWNGVYFEDATASFRHTVFRYGGESAARFRGLLDVHTADVRFESCTFVDLLFEGAYLQPDEGGTATFENCVFARVDRPIFANRGASAIVRHCVFDGNRRAIHLSGGRVDVYNSAITNSLAYGVIVEGGSTITNFVNNAFWNPRATGGNVTGTTIPAGTNGVIEGDPKFTNRAALDFRPLSGSALIDAGTAAQDVATDFRGFARLGSAPEIGAYEFTSPYTSPVDLQAEISAAPASALSGSTIDLTLSVRNAGTAAVTGPWRHAIFLRPVTGGADIAVAEFTDQPASTLAAGASTTATVRATLPEGLLGLYQFGVTVNSREEIFEGTGLANNTQLSTAFTSFDVPELPFGGSVTGRFFRSGETRVYKVHPASPGQTIHLLGDTEASRGFTQLLAARGRVPAENDFEVHSPQWDTPDATVSIANSADDWYYVRIVANELRTPTTTYSLAARAVEFQLSGVGLGLVGTAPVTISVLGTDLRNGVSVALRRTGEATTISARDVTVSGGTAADASFDLTNVAAGTYDVVVTQGGVERVLSGGVRVSSAAAAANIITTVAGPGTNRVGFPYFAAVTARNTGAADAPAPLITVKGPGMPVDLNDPQNPFFGYGFSGRDTGRDFFLAIPPAGNPSVLPAGRSAEEFLAQGLTPDGRFNVETEIITTATTTAYDLAALGSYLTPSPKPTGWDEAWALLAGSEAQTLGGLAHLTNSAANSLYRESGFRSNDVMEILARYTEAFRLVTLSNVRGRVRWSDTTVQEPLGSLRVSLARADGTIAATTDTNDDGSFSLPPIAAGTYTWEFEGAFPAAAFPAVTVNPGATLSSIELPLLVGASANARVVPLSDVPFDSMQVTLENVLLAFHTTVAPDALGNVRFKGLPEGNFRLTALAPGKPPVVRDDVVIALGTRADLGSIQFIAGPGTLKGRVTRADTQAPLANATVSVSTQNGLVTTTDTDGNYRIEGVAPGMWTLVVRAAGYAPAKNTQVAVLAGAETSTGFALTQGFTLSGTVANGATPAPDVTVDLLADTTTIASVRTDLSGAYSFANLAAGSYTVQAFKESAGSGTAPATVSADMVVNLSLTAPATIDGLVRYAGGKRPGQLGFRVTNAPGGVEYASTDDTSRFALRGLPAGDYVWSLADGGRRTPFTVGSDGTTTTSLNFSVAAGEIGGRVLAADGITPMVTFVHLIADGRIISSTASNAEGNYTFSLVAPGTYDIQAAGTEQFYSTATGVLVTADQRTIAPNIVAGLATLDVALTDSATSQPPTTFTAVFLERRNEKERIEPQLLRAVNSGGSVRFLGLSPGSYRVQAVGIGTSVAPADITVAAGDNRLSLTLNPSGFLSGKITSTGALPVADIDITVTRVSDGMRAWSGRSDVNGDYSVGGLLPGDYTIDVADLRTSPNATALVVPAPAAVTITAGETLTRNIALATTSLTLRGKVATGDGSFPFRANVSLVNSAGIEVLRRPVTSAGEYTLPLPAAGNYTLGLGAIAFTAAPQEVTVATTAQMVDVTARWAGGASQLRRGYTAFATLGGQPLKALSVGNLYDLIGGCTDNFRHLLEELLQKPPPPAPDKHPPDILKDPCYSCPDAQAAWRRVARLQMIANNQYSAWHDAWEAQVEQVAAEVGLFGTNVLKVAGALAQAELEAMEVVATLGEEIPKVGQLLASMTKPPRDAEIDLLIEHHDLLWALQDNLNGLFNLGVTSGVAGQLDNSGGKGPKFLETFSAICNPATYTSWDSIYGVMADSTGMIKAITDLASLSQKVRDKLGQSKFGKILGALDKFFTFVDPVVQAIKVWQTTLKTSAAVQDSKDLYNRVIAARDQAYTDMLLLIPLCECKGGEDCGCEPPPPKPPRPKPPRPTPGNPGGNGSGFGDRAHDPNSKYTIGYGDAGWVRPDEPLIYTITFENVATAGLPAQRVLVTDQLDSRLDWSTFELVACGFNRTSFSIPAGLQRYTTLANVATDANPVKCDLSLNPGTGLFTIDLRSVDATTGGFPRDSLAGFLPPNDAQHRGEGFVTFLVKPKAEQADGTQIRNVASIVFDTNDAIITNETLNTLDRTPPQGRVTTLARRSGNDFQVSWSGADLGSGAVAYTVWVSRDNGPWERWLVDTSATSATFSGLRGSTYRFFATAQDAVGWTTPPSFAADAETLIGLGSRLINISTRGVNGTGSEAMIVGFVISPGSSGSTPKNLLIRGIGPQLEAFHLSGVLPDPRLDLYNSTGGLMAGNDDWHAAANASELSTTFARLGAFSLLPDGRDSALLLPLAPSVYTARVTGASDSTGIALVEAYDADASFSDDTLPRLINLSTRGFVDTGDGLLIAGFVIAGDAPKTLLIRAVGPTLAEAPFLVPGVLEDPQIRLADSAGNIIRSNDNWSGAPDPALITATSQHVGAFPLPESSKDAVLVVSLNPGQYTALVSGSGNTTGVVLVEIYDADP